MPKNRVLIIAGSDPSGGAGIQADIKTVTALGGYAAAAITALTAQNTIGVEDVMEVPPEFVKKQIRLVLEDIGADCIKTGMLHNAEVIEAVASVLKDFGAMSLVVDPVMVATSGDALLNDKSGVKAIKEVLLPKATLVTPNIPEAEILSGIRIKNREDMISAGEKILKYGAKNVLIKGGHAEDDTVYDILLDKDGQIREEFTHKRIYTTNTHGTGCTLASAIATGLAKGWSLKRSVITARKYVYQAIKTAPGLGKGKGPLNHCWNIKSS